MEPEKTPAPTTDVAAEEPKPVTTSGGPSPTMASSSIPDAPSETATSAPDLTGLEAEEPMTPEVSVDPLPVGGTAPKPAKKGLIWGLIAGAVVLLLSGSAAAYYYVSNKPANVLKQSLAASLGGTKVKTVQFSGEVKLKASSGTFLADFTGTTSNESGAFDFSTTMDALVTKFKLDARSTDGKTYYLRVGGLQGLAGLLTHMSGSSLNPSIMTTYTSIINAVDNQWLEINESLISQLAKGNTIQRLSQADRDKLVQAYQQHPFLVVKQRLSDQVISGNSNYHYKVGIDKTELAAFLTAVKDANISSLKLTDEQLQSLQTSINQANTDQLVVEVWIAKSSKLISQVTLSFTKDSNSIDIRFTVDSYNKSVNVEKPAGAKSLLEMFSGLSGAMPTQDLPSGISL